MPDGISDEEKKSKKKKKKLVTVDEDADPDSLDLSQIDLTAPLRKDEVMPQRQHRVVEAAPRAEPDWAAPPPSSSKKKEKKKDKKAKKSKKKRGGDAEEDLLGFGTASPPPPPQPSGDVFDLLGTGDAPQAPPMPQAPPVDVRRPASYFPTNAGDDYPSNTSFLTAS